MKFLWLLLKGKLTQPDPPASPPGRKRRVHPCASRHLKDKDLAPIHPAASLGDVRKGPQLVMKRDVNDTEKKEE